MENKQDVILVLFRAMIELMHQLTFVSPNSNNGELMPFIQIVRITLDNFESVFMGKDFIEDSDTMIGLLTENVNRYEYPRTSEYRINYFDVKAILKRREEIKAIWRKQDQEAICKRGGK